MNLYYWKNIQGVKITAYANSREEATQIVIDSWAHYGDNDIVIKLKLELQFYTPEIITTAKSFSFYKCI